MHVQTDVLLVHQRPSATIVWMGTIILAVSARTIAFVVQMAVRQVRAAKNLVPVSAIKVSLETNVTGVMMDGSVQDQHVKVVRWVVKYVTR